MDCDILGRKKPKYKFALKSKNKNNIFFALNKKLSRTYTQFVLVSNTAKYIFIKNSLGLYTFGHIKRYRLASDSSQSQTGTSTLCSSCCISLSPFDGFFLIHS